MSILDKAYRPATAKATVAIVFGEYYRRAVTSISNISLKYK